MGQPAAVLGDLAADGLGPDPAGQGGLGGDHVEAGDRRREAGVEEDLEHVAVTAPGDARAGGAHARELGDRAQDDHVVGVGADEGRERRTAGLGEELDVGLVDHEGGRRVAVGDLGQDDGVEDDAGERVGVGHDHQVGRVHGRVELLVGGERLARRAAEAAAGEDREELGRCRQEDGHRAVGGAGGDGPQRLGRTPSGDQLAGVDAEHLGVAVGQAGGGRVRRDLQVAGREGAQGAEHGLGRPVTVEVPGQVDAAAGAVTHPALGQGGGRTVRSVERLARHRALSSPGSSTTYFDTRGANL